jgi:hypothetical protein
MQKTSGEIEKEFIDGLKGATGKELADWLVEIDSSGIAKRNEVVIWLKTERGFGHMNASLLAGIHANGGKPVYGSTGELLDNQFAKAESMRPLFNALVAYVGKHFPGATVLPKKTYVSILERREFAAINIRKDELRLGMDLGDRPFDGSISKSKLSGPMPRISHMVALNSESQFDDTLAGLLRDSWSRSH